MGAIEGISCKYDKSRGLAELVSVIKQAHSLHSQNLEEWCFRVSCSRGITCGRELHAFVYALSSTPRMRSDHRL